MAAYRPLSGGPVCQPSRNVRLTHGVEFHFSLTPLSLFGSIDDSNYPLGSGMYVDVPYLDRLLAPALKPLVCLYLVELKP